MQLANTDCFQSPMQQFMFYDKFSRWKPDIQRRERWPETVDRVTGFLHKNCKVQYSGDDWSELGLTMLKLEGIPSMRIVQMGGPALERDNTGAYNCLGRETEFITIDGVKSFNDFSDGDITTVLTHRGNWKRATVKSYGEQRLRKIRFARGRTSHTVRATSNHRWILRDDIETCSIESGDGLITPPTYLAEWEYAAALPDERLAWAYGYVYGDGTCTHGSDGNKNYSLVRLCKGENRYIDRFLECGFTYSKPLTFGGDAVVYTGSYLKEQPTHDIDIRILRAFIRGYLDADGNKDVNTGLFNSIQVTGKKHIDFVRDFFPKVGVYINREDSITVPTNFGPRSDTTVRFGITCIYGKSHSSPFYFQDAIDDAIETVWCLEVDDDHSFVMPSGIVTGNCAYAAIDDIDSIVELFYILMQGTGIGFSAEDRYVSRLPRVKKQKRGAPDAWTIEDTTEGWCNAFRTGMEHWFDGRDIEFDFSQIRSAGSLLKTKGGRASGPQPLKDLLAFTRATILNRQGRKLSTLDVHDICCYAGDVVHVGGVRRAALISLSDTDDHDIAECKNGEFWKRFPWRSMANNSAVYEEKPSSVEFMEEWLSLAKSGTGERGIFNRNRIIPVRRKRAEFGVNPCGEITLRSREFCNLSAAVAREDDTLESLERKVRLATMFGVAQSTLTYFPYLRPEWRENCLTERLLGVDITGQRDCHLFNGAGSTIIYNRLKQVALEMDRKLAEQNGLNPSVSVTTVKPSGDSAQLLNCSNGVHARPSAFYIRRVRSGVRSPVARLLKDAGVPCFPENGQDANNPSVLVFEFPIASPKDAVCADEITAKDQFRYWMDASNYTEHSVSCSIYVDDQEWPSLGAAVYDNWDKISGLSFFPKDHIYPLAPNEPITEEEYNRRVAAFPEIDYAKLIEYETADMTTQNRDYSCTSGACSL